MGKVCSWCLGDSPRRFVWLGSPFSHSSSHRTTFSSFSQPFCFWFLPLSIFLVFPLSPLVSFLFHLPLLFLLLTVLPPTTIRPLLGCVPVWHAEAPAEGGILTVSCYTANKRTFLNDELLLCKWPLTDTVSARQSPEVQSTAAAVAAAMIVIIFMIAGPQRGAKRGEVTSGYIGWVGLFTGQWLTPIWKT